MYILEKEMDMREDSSRSLALLICASTLGVACTGALGDPIFAGDDYFRSNDNRGNSLGAAVDLTAFNLGIVNLKGVPFGGSLPGVPHVTDTIVRRLDSLDPFNPGDSGTIDIELVALSLISVTPIDLGNGNFGDLHITINKGGFVPGLAQPDVLQPSIGQMQINHEDADPNGGTFEAIFGDPSDAGIVPPSFNSLLTPGGGIFANAIMTIVGGNAGNPADVMFSMQAPRLVLWSDGRWNHDPFSSFFITEIEHYCPGPSCHPAEFVPAPASLALLGLSGMAATRRRR